jgi:hypothetical protein
MSGRKLHRGTIPFVIRAIFCAVFGAGAMPCSHLYAVPLVQPSKAPIWVSVNPSCFR